MHLYFDIETIPDQREGAREEIAASITPPGNLKKPETIAKWEAEKKPAAIEEAWRDTALDGGRGELWCVAWAVDDGPIWHLSRCDLHEPEGVLVEGVLAAWEKEDADAHTWVGHYVDAFDLRFMWQRAVVLGVPLPPWLFDRVNSRRGTEDTRTLWLGRRPTDHISLDRLARTLGIEGKGDMDGSKVWDAVRGGRYDEVARYCMDDARITREIHRRLTGRAA